MLRGEESSGLVSLGQYRSVWALDGAPVPATMPLSRLGARGTLRARCT